MPLSRRSQGIFIGVLRTGDGSDRVGSKKVPEEMSDFDHRAAAGGNFGLGKGRSAEGAHFMKLSWHPALQICLYMNESTFWDYILSVRRQ